DPSSSAYLESMECYYWVRILQARFLAADYAEAIEASTRAQQLLGRVPGTLEQAEYEFYSGLTRAALCDSLSNDESRQHVDAMMAHYGKLAEWARHCPENFENRALVVAAEIARIEGRDPEAAQLYERAIRSARDNGFVHQEALALEIAAHFYAARG